MKLAIGPAAPQVADQRRRIEQPCLLHVQRGLLEYSTARLRRRDGRVVHSPGLILIERDLRAARRVAHGALQHLGLLRQDRNAERSFSTPWKAVKHGAAIVGHGRVVARLGRGDLCIALAAIEDRLARRGRPATRRRLATCSRPDNGDCVKPSSADSEIVG